MRRRGLPVSDVICHDPTALPGKNIIMAGKYTDGLMEAPDPSDSPEPVSKINPLGCETKVRKKPALLDNTMPGATGQCCAEIPLIHGNSVGNALKPSS